MQTPSTLSLWLSQQAAPIAVIAVVIAVVLLTLYLSARRRHARMNEERSGTNEDTFVNDLVEYGFDPTIARSTYRYLQEEQGVTFPIEAHDLLDEDLGLDSEEVDQSIQHLFQICARLYQPGLRHTPLMTVEDLVRFIQASPRMSEIVAA